MSAVWWTRTGGGLLGAGLMLGCTSGVPSFGSEAEMQNAETTPVASDAEIVITELMANPEGVEDADGEWIELYNAGGSTIDLEGFTVVDASDTSFEITDVTIEKGAFVVLGRNATSEANGGVVVDFEYTNDFTLANGEEYIALHDLNGSLVDDLAYDKAPAGASLSLDPYDVNVSANDNSDNLCASKYSLLGSGDLGTPGAINDVCVVRGSVGALIFTEIMANPEVVSDARGEFLEVYNASSASINLDGWVLTDGVNTYEINSHGELKLDSRAYLVFGNHFETSENGGASIDWSWEDALSLSDSSAELSLIAGDTVVDSVAYGVGDFPTTPAGASLQLDAGTLDSSANDDGNNWCETSSQNVLSGGEYGTPGAANETCPQ